MSYYDEVAPTCVVDVLGTQYAIYTGVMPEYDPLLNTCDGYHDKTCKRIAVVGRTPDADIQDWDAYSKSCVRHELVHAFLYESGIDANMKWDVAGQDHPEHLVSWIALQFPKMLKAFQDAGVI